MTNTQRWWILAGMSAALALSYLDITAVAVSLPQIQHLLHGTEKQIHWVMNAYFLTMTVFIVAGGRLGDLRGHKIAFLSGAVGFLLTSILCALATSFFWLILGRLLQGAAAALLISNTSTIMLTLFPEAQRGKSNGIYIGIASIFLAFGPFIGGLLTELFNWRWVFWINVPLLLFSITVASLLLEKKNVRHKAPFDWLGLLTLCIALTSLCLALMEGTDLGWRSNFILLSFLTSLVFLCLFVFIEKHAKTPLIYFHLLRNQTYLGAAIVTFFIQAVLMITIFMPLWYQIVLGKTPLTGGILGLPTTVPILFLAPIVGKIIDHYGFKTPTLIGLIIYFFSVLSIALLLKYENYFLILAGVIGVGIAIPIATLPILLVGLSVVPHKHHGMGVGTLYTVRQAGGAIGMATMSALFSFFYSKELSTALLQIFALKNNALVTNIKHLLATHTLSPNALSHVNSSQITLITKLAKQAYTTGVTAILWASALMLLICIIIVTLMRNRRITSAPSTTTIPLSEIDVIDDVS